MSEKGATVPLVNRADLEPPHSASFTATVQLEFSTVTLSSQNKLFLKADLALLKIWIILSLLSTLKQSHNVAIFAAFFVILQPKSFQAQTLSAPTVAAFCLDSEERKK